MKITKTATLLAVSLIFLLSILVYMCVGTATRVDEIKALTPAAFSERGWEIMRYEGYQYGSMGNHGGKVFYHVRNKDNHSIQYRVYVTLWNGELHYVYGSPEILNRIDVNYR